MHLSRIFLLSVLIFGVCTSVAFAATKAEPSKTSGGDKTPPPNFASCVPQGTQALFLLQEKSTKAIDCSARVCDRRTNKRQVNQTAYVAQIQGTKGDVICGKATHFADLQGRKTASGLTVNNAVFEMMATRVHPLGTVLRACRVSTGKCAYFAVVDVGPGQGDGIQIFDFLKGGAQYFGFWGGVNSGTAKDICTETIMVMEGGKKGSSEDDAKAALAAARCLNQSFEKDAGSIAGALQNMTPGGVDAPNTSTSFDRSPSIQDRVAGLVQGLGGGSSPSNPLLSRLLGGGMSVPPQTSSPLMTAWQSSPQNPTQSSSQSTQPTPSTAVLQIEAKPQSVKTGENVGLTWSAAGVKDGSCSVQNSNKQVIARGESGTKHYPITAGAGGAVEITFVCTDTTGKEVKEPVMVFVEDTPLTPHSSSGTTFLGGEVPEFESDQDVKVAPSDTVSANPEVYDDLLAGQPDRSSNSTFGAPTDDIAVVVDLATGEEVPAMNRADESAVLAVIGDVLKNIQTALNQIGKMLLGR